MESYTADVVFWIALLGMAALSYFLDMLCCRVLALFQLPERTRRLIRILFGATLAIISLMAAFYAATLVILRL